MASDLPLRHDQGWPAALPRAGAKEAISKSACVFEIQTGRIKKRKQYAEWFSFQCAAQSGVT